MTALEFYARKDGHKTKCQIRGCGSPGRWKVLMAGWPAGIVCGSHRSYWSKTWAECREH